MKSFRSWTTSPSNEYSTSLMLTNEYLLKDMADITSPLKQFTDAVLCQEALARKRELVEQFL